MKRQLFILPAETVRALKIDELEATETALRECGAYALPYPEVDIWLPANGIVGWTLDEFGDSGWNREILDQYIRQGLFRTENGRFFPVTGSGFVYEFHRLSLDHLDYTIGLRIDPSTPAGRLYLPCSTGHDANSAELSKTARDSLCRVLIVLLATRNAVKTVQRDKLAALGCAKRKHRHEYITTITLPQERPDAEGATAGSPKRPHLRRGHVRRQHHGPHNELVKMIFVPPVFVNADKDWVESRHHYNVSL